MLVRCAPLLLVESKGYHFCRTYRSYFTLLSFSQQIQVGDLNAAVHLFYCCDTWPGAGHCRKGSRRLPWSFSARHKKLRVRSVACQFSACWPALGVKRLKLTKQHQLGHVHLLLIQPLALLHARGLVNKQGRSQVDSLKINPTI